MHKKFLMAVLASAFAAALMCAQADAETLPTLTVIITDAPAGAVGIPMTPLTPFTFTVPGDAPSSGSFDFLNAFFRPFEDFHIGLSDKGNIGYGEDPTFPYPPLPPFPYSYFSGTSCVNTDFCGSSVQIDPYGHTIPNERVFHIAYAFVPGTHLTREIVITFTPSPIPEPAVWINMIVGVGLAGVALRRRGSGRAARLTA